MMKLILQQNQEKEQNNISETNKSQGSNIIAKVTCIGVASASSLVAGYVQVIRPIGPHFSKRNLMQGCVAGGMAGSITGFIFGTLEGCAYKLIGHQETNIFEISKSRSRTGANCWMFGLIGEFIGEVYATLLEVIFDAAIERGKLKYKVPEEKKEIEEKEEFEILQIESNMEDDDDFEILQIESNNEEEDKNKINQQD
ncbi:unnamed protein product (macronuclear) [Paramecium tetraurelia]|uniref:Mitochondrial import inner membrane translocase subunit TIM22 n=1 Tax=Paramecium tetraurelia TaxID=5888 RepID=A0DSZ6_PARTE|nr:uncharacterized protein GSPATT00019856001 [Paramecium tetraurelia]CAK86163.1 unnamed protein product [Paramecium tetraurelia]|eukprot:XP_001453560.1 hypothetical protein (macronuclear) [Paramecium tetraurelia strain d4-2]